jgi:hypothetical protein
MKNYILPIGGLLMAFVSMVSCNDKDPIVDQKMPTKNCDYKQRWIYKEYPNTMKIITDSLVYTVYDTDGKFGEIEDAIPNPERVWIIGDSLYIQRRRTEIDAYKIDFRCDCQVMDLTATNGYVISHYREGFDVSQCP